MPEHIDRRILEKIVNDLPHMPDLTAAQKDAALIRALEEAMAQSLTLRGAGHTYHFEKQGEHHDDPTDPTTS